MGEEHKETIREANNYALLLLDLRRFAEAKSVLRQTLAVARRVLGESNNLTLEMRSLYAQTLYNDDGATIDDLREFAEVVGAAVVVRLMAVDDADQPTTTFVGLAERVEGTPLNKLERLRPRHLALASAALDRFHRLGFRHGDGHLGNFILGDDGAVRLIDFEEAARNPSCARDGCGDQIFLTRTDVEHLRNGTSLSTSEAWNRAGTALGAKRAAHSSMRRFFLDTRKAVTT